MGDAMTEKAYRSKLSCGHTHIGMKKVKAGKSLYCPLDGKVTVVSQEEGKIEAYIGFVPSRDEK